MGYSPNVGYEMHPLVHTAIRRRSNPRGSDLALIYD